jgi:fructosamine-3-kinase
MSIVITELLKNTIAKKLNCNKEDLQLNSVSGGSINYTVKISIKNKENYFIKINDAKKFPGLFLQEKSGLQLLQKQNIFIVPNVIDNFEVDNKQILILEWIDSGNKTNDFWKHFGKQLAQLHFTSNENFGLESDNYMGSVIQKNNQSKDWIYFFIHQRLQPLINECITKKLLTTSYIAKFENLYKHLPSIYTIEKPSLLHGDLWSGNFICNHLNQPVLIDPAIYFGHRSVDLGMTTLFGGFEKQFYKSYQYHFPLPKNHKEQWQVSNLYPLLIHLLLFGKSYLSSIDSVLNTYQ